METNWSSLSALVKAEILEVIREDFGFTSMTPVQAACIPQMLNYKDVVAEAVTGSGKTMAFLVPMLQIMMRKDGSWGKHQIGGVVIAPTRELATQISLVLEKFIQRLGGFTQQVYIGGSSVDQDLEKFRVQGGNILIVTPGRFHDLLLLRVQENSLLKSGLKHLEVLILDEADHLLSLGFEKALNGILQMMPKQRRTGLFSATQTTEVAKLVRAGLRNPVSVVVVDKTQKGKVPGTLDNNYAVLEPQYKLHALINFIKSQRKKKILVFFATCACVDYFSFVMKKVLKDVSVTSMHGKMKEKIRLGIFENFRESEEGIMCCTDVMARGIDITKKIHWVVQFDPPSNPAFFIHRSGRTARNGEEGWALLLLQPNEADYVRFVEVSQKVKINEMSMEPHLNENTFSKHLDVIHQLQLKDKAIYEKAVRAFVSYYKAYSKYTCSLILRAKDLDLGAIATSYGLIKFPKMSECSKPTNFVELDVDINSLQYKDKQKEQSRKRKLEVFQSTGVWPEKNGGKKKKFQKETTSWSVAKEKRAKKLLKKQKHSKGEGTKNGLSESEISAMEKAMS